MTPHGTKANRDSGAVNERPSIHPTQSFEKALAALGSEDKAAVVARLQEFEKDWASGVSDEELHRHWDYKALFVSKKCKQHGLRQIKPTYNTRAWMAPNTSGSIMRLLWVIRKTSRQEQQRIIDRLCNQLSKVRS